jgi:hypothetical protein
MRRDTSKKSITTSVALGWTRMSTDKMFSEQLVLHKSVFNVQNGLPIHIMLICIWNVCKLSSQRSSEEGNSKFEAFGVG